MNKIQIRINELLDKLVSRGVFLGLLVGLLPAALIIYLGHSMWLAPAMIEAEGKEKQVLALKAEVEKGRAVEKSEDEFKREFKKTVELFYDTLPLLPKETELSNVMLSVQSVAARCNVTLTGLNAVKIGQKTPNADKLYEREYPAVVVGNYDDVMRFFLDLSRQTRILIVRDYKVVSASEKQKGARPQVVSVDFSLLAYHAPPTSEYPANIPPNMLPNTTVASGTNAKTTAQPDAEKKGE